jgi:hypothetical protein
LISRFEEEEGRAIRNEMKQNGKRKRYLKNEGNQNVKDCNKMN